MKLFLCSHFSSVGSLIKEEIENKKVAFIPTASLREGYTGYVGSARKLFKKLGAIVTEIDISTEAYSTIQSVFEDADVIYFTGGNSFFLIDQLRKTGTDELLKKELAKGKLMIGESAGIHGDIHPQDGAAFINFYFQGNVVNTVLYLIWFVALWFHLTHGFWSAIHTIGWNNTVWLSRWECISKWVATIICGLFAVITVIFYLNGVGA